VVVWNVRTKYKPSDTRNLQSMRAILFDKDGTLLDFERTWTPLMKRVVLEAARGDAVQAAALLAAGGYDAEIGRFRSGSVVAAGTSDLIVRLWFPRLRGAAFDAKVEKMDRVFAAHGRDHSVPIDGVNAALDLLAARGYVMGVATNDATAAATVSLTSTGMIRNLPHVFGYDSVATPKPAADMVFAFCDAARVKPDEIAVVGDNAHDLVMARSAGAALAIGVTSGNSAAADLAPLADVVIGSIRDLPAWLQQNRR
jgi:phosphoglycolate phosphatase